MHLRGYTAAALVVASVAAFAVHGAHADTITNINASNFDTGASSGTWSDSWTNQINGPAIVSALQGGTGNTGTGLNFSNSSGSYLGLNEGATAVIDSMSIGLSSNSTVNALFNTFYGDSPGTTEAQITFTNSDNHTLTLSLVAGATIRDYNNSTFADTLTGSSSGVTAENWWNTGDASSNSNNEPNQRLDAQIFALPSSWDGTNLTKVQIFDPSTAQYGALDILSAMQVDVKPDSITSAVPEPATWSLMMVAFGLFGGLAMRRRSSRAA